MSANLPYEKIRHKRTHTYMYTPWLSNRTCVAVRQIFEAHNFHGFRVSKRENKRHHENYNHARFRIVLGRNYKSCGYPVSCTDTHTPSTEKYYDSIRLRMTTEGCRRSHHFRLGEINTGLTLVHWLSRLRIKIPLSLEIFVQFRYVSVFIQYNSAYSNTVQ